MCKEIRKKKKTIYLGKVQLNPSHDAYLSMTRTSYLSIHTE